MVRDLSRLDWKSTKKRFYVKGLEVHRVVTGERCGTDGFSLVTKDEGLYHQNEKGAQSIFNLSDYQGCV